MPLIEQLLAALVLAICVGLLLRQMLGAQRRARLDRWAQRLWWNLTQRLRGLRRGRSSREEAQREAEAAIRRARESSGEWDGNVYRPESFRRPKKPH
jgi:hypothetical protein